ncbi:MAG: 2Fe-2S iron-sulfur cluster-binding protein [Bacteroidota bacterium]
MATITFITPTGETIPATGDGGSVMELALKHNVSGIDGNCGGVCSCATCHVHVAPEDFAKTGPAGDLEADMLEFDENVSEYSRLCCQITVGPDLNGITLTVPG